MSQLAAAQTPDAATDPRIDPQIRAFLAELNKDSNPFWELPQPKPQDILTALQNQTPVDMSGVTTTEKTIKQDGRAVKLYIMKPQHVTGKPGVLLFVHGGVWIVGNFENHQRLLRDLVVGSGQIGVFVEYTSLPAAKYPTQMEASYAALQWVAAYTRLRYPDRAHHSGDPVVHVICPRLIPDPNEFRHGTKRFDRRLNGNRFHDEERAARVP